MQFEDGAQVISADGEKVGKITRVVIEPETKEATHIVIQKGLLFTEDKIVPMSMVGPAGEEHVELRVNAGSLDQLPDFEESHFIATETAILSSAHSPSGIGSVYWYPPVASRWTIDNPMSGGDRRTKFSKQTTQNIPKGAIALKEGAKVYSRDEQIIGNIERVITSSPEEKVSHLLVSQGLIWTEKKLVPVNWINEVGEDVVRLSVTTEFIENLPEYQP